MRFSDVTVATANLSSVSAAASPGPTIVRANTSPESALPSSTAAPSAMPATLPQLAAVVGSTEDGTHPASSPATNANVPVEVSIKRRTPTTEYDAPGNVFVVY